MKTLTTAFVPLLLGILLVSSGAGCGGGGGGTAPPGLTPTQLHGGPYFYQALSGNFGPPSAVAWWGDYTSGGAGTVTGGTLNANNAGANASAPITPYLYTVDAAHHMVWAAGSPAQQTGGLSADGRVGVLTATANASFPTLAVALRRSGAFSSASLLGTYHVACAYRAGGSVAGMWGTANFNGVSGVTWALTRNLNTAIAGAAYPMGSYGVAPDGTVDISLGTAALHGGMLAGGELIAVTGTTLPASPQLMMLLVPQSTTAGLATFAGSYHLGILGLLFGGPPHYASLTGLLNADGIGGLGIPVGAILNDDGAIATAPIAIPGTYTVAPNGTLTISTMTGAVSPSGAFAILAGRTSGGSDPELWVMAR